MSRRFARAFRARLPHLPAALSSFGRIDLHPGLDWRAWCDAGFDFHPQAYACESAALSPRACVERATAVWPRDRIRPTLGAYRGAAGRPSAAALADSVRGLGATGSTSGASARCATRTSRRWPRCRRAVAARRCAARRTGR